MNPKSFTCDSIHNNGCLEPIFSHFCPRCGRIAAHVDWDAFSGATYSLEPDKRRKQVYLVNRGPVAVAARASIEGANSELTLDRPNVVIPAASADGPGRAPLSFRFASDSRNGSATLAVSAQDGSRDFMSDNDDDPLNVLWNPQPSREIPRKTIRWSERGGPKMVVRQDLLIFHGELTDQIRSLNILNDGQQPLHVLVPPEPDGFRMSPAAGEYVIHPAEEMALDVTCYAAHPYDDDETVLSIATREGLSHDVILRTVAEPGGYFQPDCIIGLDFGTTNTSIVARRKGPNGVLTDEIIPVPGPIPPDGSAPLGSERFPSAICHYRDSWTFAWDALSTAEQHDLDPEPVRPRLFHEDKSLKSSLHNEAEPFIHLDTADSALRLEALAERYFRWLHSSFIQPFLRHRSNGDTLHVEYVLTLPVLDGEGGPKYNRQKTRTLKAASRAFAIPETSIRTVYEPQSAAMHFFLGASPLRDNEVRFDDGDGVCVFDSGGGTTDIYFGKVEMKNGRLTLRAIHNLGLSASGHTFGGTSITRALHRVFNTADYKSYHSPCAVINEKSSDSVESRSSGIEPRGDVSCSSVSSTFLDDLKRDYIAAAESNSRGDVIAETTEGVSAFLGTEQSEVLVSATADRLAEVLNEIDSYMRSVYPAVDSLFTSEELPPIRWLFPVGGNTMVRRVEQWAQTLCSEREYTQVLAVGPQDRTLAVACGAPFALDIPLEGRAPYSLKGVLRPLDGRETREETLIEIGRYAPLRDLPERRIPFMGEIELSIVSEDGRLDTNTDGPAVLFRRSFKSNGNASIIARFIERWLEITYQTYPGASEEAVVRVLV